MPCLLPMSFLTDRISTHSSFGNLDVSTTFRLIDSIDIRRQSLIDNNGVLWILKSWRSSSSNQKPDTEMEAIIRLTMRLAGKRDKCYKTIKMLADFGGLDRRWSNVG